MNLVPVSITSTEDSTLTEGAFTPEELDDTAAAQRTPPFRSISKGLSPQFGDRRKRQAQLVARLKRRRRYGPPVRGGTKPKSKRSPRFG